MKRHPWQLGNTAFCCIQTWYTIQQQYVTQQYEGVPNTMYPTTKGYRFFCRYTTHIETALRGRNEKSVFFFCQDLRSRNGLGRRARAANETAARPKPWTGVPASERPAVPVCPPVPSLSRHRPVPPLPGLEFLTAYRHLRSEVYLNSLGTWSSFFETTVAIWSQCLIKKNVFEFCKALKEGGANALTDGKGHLLYLGCRC